jgi:tripartite-type tricarboxylate transporter receptor subunit TctC
LQGKLGQAVVIDNKPGGGTTIGSKAAAVAPPDGYTLLFASSAPDNGAKDQRFRQIFLARGVRGDWRAK